MRRIIVSTIIMLAAASAAAINLSLDTIATWGRFPRFAVDTYRWGARFFNGYDTTYVSGTGYPFHLALRSESWTDTYAFRLSDDTRMTMVSRPSTTAGIYLTYLAVSAGYDMNVSKWFGGDDRIRRRWNFQFCCMLFTADLYFLSNDVRTRITSIRPDGGPTFRPSHDFDAIDNNEWGLDINYYFNHHRYSAAAVTNFSRIQRRSGGSFFAGFNYHHRRYSFDFNTLPTQLRALLPDDALDYRADSRNYFIKLGYGYNWVVGHGWVIGLQVAPMAGVSYGRVSGQTDRLATFALQSDTRLAAIFNHDRWYAGAIASVDASLMRNSHRQLASAYLTLRLSAGLRFAIP